MPGHCKLLDSACLALCFRAPSSVTHEDRNNMHIMHTAIKTNFFTLTSSLNEPKLIESRENISYTRQFTAWN